MKIKVGVIFGGKSVEHEVSIISAIQAINNFDKDKYDVIPIYMTKNNEMYVGELIGKISSYNDISKLTKNSQRVIMLNDLDKVILEKYPMKKFGKNQYAQIDVVFPIVHGTNVEDGTLQGYLKILNIPFVGCDVTSSAVGMDKYVMKTILKDNDVPVLDCTVINKHEYIEDNKAIANKIKKEISFPVIVKPINLGSSVGIKIARNDDELFVALDHAFNFASQILVEKAITNLREINCSVMGDITSCTPSQCEEPLNKGEILSYEDKYISNKKNTPSKGMSSLERQLPANIDEKVKNTIQEYAIKTFKLLNCNGVVRIDFMIDIDSNKIYVNEINTIPGSLSFYLWEASGLKYKELLTKLVELAFKRKREESSISYKFDTNILENFDGGTKGGKI